MTKMMIPATLCFLLWGLGSARADVAVFASLVVTPPVPMPTLVPPLPPYEPPVVPVAHYVPPRAVLGSPTVAGAEWVYTAQYGWLYMPYGDQYVYAHAASPYAYVYYPTFGWRWLAAPWIMGAGPYPHFGGRGPFAYGWYRGLHRAGHPWAVHEAYVHGGPWVAPRAAAPGRPGFRGPASHAPSRPGFAPRTTAVAPRPTMVVQRSVGSVARGPAAPRGGFGNGRALGRR